MPAISFHRFICLHRASFHYIPSFYFTKIVQLENVIANASTKAARLFNKKEIPYN